MNFYKNILAILVWFLPLVVVYGQHSHHYRKPDIGGELRLSTRVNIELNKKWNFSIENQFRLHTEGQVVDQNYLELGVEYNFWKNLEAGFSYRLILKNDDKGNVQEAEVHHRFNFFASYKWKVECFALKLRGQYQTRRELFWATNYFVGDVGRYWRLKTTLDYNFKKWKLDPKVSVEFFLRPINYNRGQYNKYRLSLETGRKLGTQHHISIKYTYEREMRRFNPEVVHLIQLKYTYNIELQTQKYKYKNSELND